MKKTLTLFLMAAVALTTGTVFTSCSGGGDGEKSPDNVVTRNDFSKAKKQLVVEGLLLTIITPENSKPEAHGAPDMVYSTGYVDFAGAMFDCDFDYSTDEDSHDDGIPRMSWLIIHFRSVDATTSTSTLASLGMDPQGTGLVGEGVKIQFNFTTHEAQVLSSTQGTVTLNYPDPMGEYVTFSAWVRSVINNPFYVTRNGSAGSAGQAGNK